MTSTPSSPVFVCGADRTGTSLMYALLASHPSISMVRRTNMWRWFNGRFGPLSNMANLDRALEAMASYERLSVLEPDWPRVRTELVVGEPTYGRLFELLHRHRAERIGRPRWGDKSLHTEYYAKEIFSAFPSARLVHMVRDPRDRYSSIAHRPHSRSGAAPKGIAAATGRWLSSVHAAAANRRRYPGRCLVVRYEDLAAEPTETMAATCEFIGERFDPAMMTMGGAPEHSAGNSSFSDVGPDTISTKPIGRYRSTLSPSDIAFIQLTAGRAMRRLGYTTDPAELGPKRIRFFLGDAPVEISKMTAWSLRDRYERPRATAPPHRLTRSMS